MMNAFIDKMGELDDKITTRGIFRATAIAFPCALGALTATHFGSDVPSACSVFASAAGDVVALETVVSCAMAAFMMNAGKDASVALSEIQNEENDIVKGFAQGTFAAGSLAIGAYVLSKVF